MKTWLIGWIVSLALPLMAVPQAVEALAYEATLLEPLPSAEAWVLFPKDRHLQYQGSIVQNEVGQWVRISTSAPHPMQRFTATLTQLHLAPETTQYTYTIKKQLPQPTKQLGIALFKTAALPPCEVKSQGDTLALVAKDESWYVLFQHPDTLLSITQEEIPTITARLKPQNFDTKPALTFSFIIGEGHLPQTDDTH